MKITLHPCDGLTIVEVAADRHSICRGQDVLELLGNKDTQGVRLWILHEQALSPAFFDLSSGVAGEILQKFSNYRLKVAIVGEFDHRKSKSLQAFIGESNRGGEVLFVKTVEQAKSALLSGGRGCSD